METNRDVVLFILHYAAADPGFPRGWAPITGGGALTYYYRPQRSCGKVMFSEVCVKNSVLGGHVWQGRAWQGGRKCMVAGGGGMHGRLCAWWGHAWQWGVCGRGGHAWQRGMHECVCGRGACMAGDMCGSWRACMARECVWQGGCAWQEKWPLEWAVRILLECILVWQIFFQKLYGNEKKLD